MGITTTFVGGFFIRLVIESGSQTSIDAKTLKKLEKEVQKRLEEERYSYIQSSWKLEIDEDGAFIVLKETDVNNSPFWVIPHLFIIIDSAYSLGINFIGEYELFSDDFAGGVVSITPQKKNDALVKVVRTIRPSEDSKTPTEQITATLKHFLSKDWKDEKKYVDYIYKSEVKLVPEGTESTKSKKGGKARKKKDPNAPKRAQTAYFLWFNDNRETIKKANPGAKVTEIAKIAGQQWKTLPAKNKKKYEDLNAKDKERYQKEMTAYKAL